MAQIRTIYEESHEIYGAPKIAAKMQQKGDRISKRTVGKYMREIGIRACYRKHSTHTTRDSDFSSGLKNILNRDFQSEASSFREGKLLATALKVQFRVRFPLSSMADNKYPKKPEAKKKSIEKSKDEILSFQCFPASPRRLERPTYRLGVKRAISTQI